MTQLTSLSEVCSLPWVHTEINLQNNSVGPCCKFQGKLGPATDGFNVVWYNSYTKNLRKDFVNGIIRNECFKCADSKDAFTYKSWKNNFYEKLGILNDIDVDNPRLPKVFHFSLNNVCNLACRMCNPGSSSKINSLALNPKFNKFFQPIAVNNKFSIQHFKGSFINAEYVTISGGEPLVNADCLDLINLISEESKKLKAVAFSTNMTVINKDLLELLSRLDVKVKFNISIDGPPHIHEYIRVGCKWNSIVANIKYIRDTYPKFKFGINTTISALNVGYIPLLLESLKTLQDQCDVEFLEIMPSPVFNEYLHVGVLPLEIKQLYKLRLEQIDPNLLFIPSSQKIIATAQEFLEKDFSNNLSKFIEFTEVFDESVNSNITSVYPEFARLYNVAPLEGIEPP